MRGPPRNDAALVQSFTSSHIVRAKDDSMRHLEVSVGPAAAKQDMTSVFRLFVNEQASCIGSVCGMRRGVKREPRERV